MQKSSRLNAIADRCVTVGVVTLPYLIYLGLLGFFGAIITTIWVVRGKLLRPGIIQVLLVIAIGLLLNVALSFYKAEAALQLANFLPFFLIFAVFIQRLTSVQHLYALAWRMIVGSIPVNLIAIAEYILKVPSLKARIDHSNLVLDWIYRHNYGHRANSVFGHPNTYVSYLLVVLALGLGLLLTRQQSPPPAEFRPAALGVPTLPANRWRSPGLLFLALALIAVGIFCAGSRNGLFLAVCQLIVVSLTSRQRALRLAGLWSGVLLVGAAFIGGIGGRQITMASLLSGLMADPRPTIWRIALNLGWERPWWGWGLGNFKYLYPPRSFRPDYPFVSHAHNFWLQMFAETGILITIAFTLAIGYIAYRGVRVYQSRQLSAMGQGLMMGYQLGMWSFMLFAMLDLPYYDARINGLNWLMLAGVYGLAQTGTAAAHPADSTGEPGIKRALDGDEGDHAVDPEVNTA